jgi:uncharacterized protein
MKYEERTYRSLINKDNLTAYNVTIAESDLLICSDINLTDSAEDSIIKHRHSLETYIKKYPQFRTSLLPLSEDDLAPPIIRDMLAKSGLCGVGPMAAVAGAISEFVGRDLQSRTENLIIENGGDIYLKSTKIVTVSIFAGESPLSYKIKFIVDATEKSLGVCTSSATVGPSLNFGRADAVCVISNSATLSDAAATAVGNKVKSRKDIKRALDFGIGIEDVQGLIIIYGEEMGAIGEVEFV